MISEILSLTILILVIYISARTIRGFIIGAPILFSSKLAIRDALKFCQIESGKKFYDLGAGTGRAMIIADKEFGAQTFGFELSPLLAVIAKINLFLNGAKNSEIYSRDFYKVDLIEVDIVFCFLTPKAMRRLSPKFKKELKPGAKIISYSFSLPEWPPEKIITGKYPGKIFIYKA